MNVRLHIDSWDPAYGTGFDAEAGPATASSAKTDPDVELPRDQWRPLSPPPHLTPPDVVLLVDGVRRIDARVWAEEPDGSTYPGLAASFAAGVVRCDLRRGAADVLVARVARGLFTASPHVTDLVTGPIHYQAYQVARGEPNDLVQAVQPRMTALEAGVSTTARSGVPGRPADDDALLIVDGPLRDRRHLAHTIGYIKTHHKQYLPPQLSTVVGKLAAGERSPIFELGEIWHRYSWYVKLPGPPGSPWAGVVRVECAAELPLDAVTELADLSAVTLPRFASHAYKDPRAPQNLAPIAGLEKRLRGMLGDTRLLHRALTTAAHRGAGVR